MSFDFLSFVFGALFGSGSVWKLLQYNINRRKLQIEQAESSSKLRNRLIDLMFSLKEKNENYADVRSEKVKVSGILPNILNQLQTEIDFIYDDILTIEYQLSKIESRAARSINKCHGGRPATVTNVRVE